MEDSLFNRAKTRNIIRLTTEFSFHKREDSLKLKQERERTGFETDQRQAKQTITYFGLGLVSLLVVVLGIFYWDKQKNNRKLNQSNEQLADVNEELHQQKTRLQASVMPLKSKTKSYIWQTGK